MAQSWAATWHPVVGSPVFGKIVVVSPGSNSRPPSGQRAGRTGLTARPEGVPCYVYGANSI
jgi:hypothetical protein